MKHRWWIFHSSKLQLVRWRNSGCVLEWVCFLVSCLMAASLKADLSPKTVAFLQTHCFGCHGEEKQKGDLRLDTLSQDFTDPEATKVWAEVRFRMHNAEMPPPEEPQPTPEALAQITEEITFSILKGRAARQARRGPVSHHRLSRSEYVHTLYDLLGVVFDAEAPGALNEDPRWHGFDRLGSMLTMAPSHLQRYYEAAEQVIQEAFPDTPRESKVERKEVGEQKRRLLQLGEGWSIHLPDSGRYRIRISASGLAAFTGKLPYLCLWHEHHKRSFQGRVLDAAEEAPEIIEFEGLFPAGHYQIRNHARTIKHANGGISMFLNELIDASQPVASLRGGHRSPWTKVVDEEGRPTMPLLLVDWAEIEGPLLLASDLAKREGVVPEEGLGPEAWLASLQGFATRAWRRPVDPAQIQPYIALIESEQEAGESFRSAYRTALSTLLTARGFLYLEEGDPETNRSHLQAHEWANRLSYFLWSSMPDAALLDVAQSGAWTTPSGVEAQVQRMFEDPKIDRFLESFPSQWLQLHRVGMFEPDPELYPRYGPWLEESMIHETKAYFAEMFRGNHPIAELVDSDWTLLNPRLAEHYQLPVTHPTDWARVDLPPHASRGGMLTHASILSLTSDGTRHRPVHRGAWLSEVILATKPSPPPPNVDPLEPVSDGQPKITIRDQIQAHATDANCRSCHAKLDPLGLAFEHFDAIGRWREVESVRGGTGDLPKVDASGTLADGRSFQNHQAFKKLLVEDPRTLALAFMEQLATYALRRMITVDDMESIEAMVDAHGDHAYPLRDLIQEFILSDLFARR